MFDYSNFSTKMCAVLLIKILGTSMCFCWTVTIIAVWVFVHYPSCCCSIIHFIKYLFPASLQINKYALKKEKNNTAIHFYYHRRLLAVNRLYIYDEASRSSLKAEIPSLIWPPGGLKLACKDFYNNSKHFYLISTSARLIVTPANGRS